MTSTGTYQGLQDGRNSSKVLKPPGGGSSDIFGSGNEALSPRRTKQSFNQSTLGSGFFGNGEQAAQPSQPQSNGSATSQSSSNGGSAPETPRSKPDGNPVTGAGYEANPPSQQNGSGGKSPSIGSEKSSTDSSPSTGGANAAVRMKNRVPPGGFSSGLW